MKKRFTAAVVAACLGFFAVGAPASASADSPYWQCVTFARMFSGINIFGDAWTWWNQATSKFRTGHAPETGAVLVFRPEGRMSRGHVAVVSDILNDRLIQVTHANWGGSRGRVEENVIVADMSSRNDWSQVKVWYNPIHDLGTTVYPTYGFIYKGDTDAFDGQQQAASRLASLDGSAGQP